MPSSSSTRSSSETATAEPATDRSIDIGLTWDEADAIHQMRQERRWPFNGDWQSAIFLGLIVAMACASAAAWWHYAGIAAVAVFAVWAIRRGPAPHLMAILDRYLELDPEASAKLATLEGAALKQRVADKAAK